MKKILSSIGLFLLLIPASVVITFLLMPFWSWLEKNTGIEAVGHSGPSEWCFVAVFAIISCGFVAVFLLWKKKI
jgi:hypothetical protein